MTRHSFASFPPKFDPASAFMLDLSKYLTQVATLGSRLTKVHEIHTVAVSQPKLEKLMDTQIIVVFCLCDDMLKSLHHYEDRQCQMSDAEVMATAGAGFLLRSTW